MVHHLSPRMYDRLESEYLIHRNPFSKLGVDLHHLVVFMHLMFVFLVH